MDTLCPSMVMVPLPAAVASQVPSMGSPNSSSELVPSSLSSRYTFSPYCFMRSRSSVEVSSPSWTIFEISHVPTKSAL